MKMLLRICLTALLLLQVIAQPPHAFSQELQHLAAGDSHHHAHNHSEHLPNNHFGDSPASQNANDSLSALTSDSSEHSCISHCHVPAALLYDTTLFKPIPMRFAATSECLDNIQFIAQSIERPKWNAARS